MTDARIPHRMFARLGLILSAVVHIDVSHAASIEYPYQFTFTGNPLVTHVAASDPDVHVWDDTLWLYTSMDANLKDHGIYSGNWTYDYMDGYHAFSTTDMIHWTDHGEIFHSRNCQWAGSGAGTLWAPGVVRKDNVYYLYYPHKDQAGDWRIGVAKAPQPAGPFVDTGAPIAGLYGIDPMVFEDNGEFYIYHTLNKVARLETDMVSLADEAHRLTYGSDAVMRDPLRSFEEGPYLHQHDGVYYYSYSRFSTEETMAYYAMGDSPEGPFEWRGALAGSSRGAQDHHSVVEFQGKHFYFSHMDTPEPLKDELDWFGHRRIVCFDEMVYNPDGTIQLQQHQFGTPGRFRVNAGGARYYSNDEDITYDFEDYLSGTTDRHTVAASINGTSDEYLYQSERFGKHFGYNVPMANGEYTVILKFAEIHMDWKGSRVFNVEMEGVTVIQELDIFTTVGKNTALDIEHVVTVRDGELNIWFISVVDQAKISAIRIEPRDERPATTIISESPTPSSSSTRTAQNPNDTDEHHVVSATEGTTSATTIRESPISSPSSTRTSTSRNANDTNDDDYSVIFAFLGALAVTVLVYFCMRKKLERTTKDTYRQVSFDPIATMDDDRDFI